MTPGALHYLEFELVVLARLVLLIFLVLLFLVAFFDVLGRIIELLVVDAVVQLSIIVEFVLPVYFTAKSTQTQNEGLLHDHGLDSFLENFDIFALG